MLGETRSVILLVGSWARAGDQERASSTLAGGTALICSSPMRCYAMLG
jgi:hypothetical protein